MKYRNDIQGLRALAVLFVFIFHLSNKFLPGGFVGVDMFFVISGYLISKIVLKKISTEKFNLFDFYIGRIKRIVPAYYFLLVIIWIFFLFIFANADTATFKLAHFWAVLFNSNNYFGKLDNYFGASSSENPLLHTWTLGVEMQFYFILPLLLIGIKNKNILIWALTFITALLFAYSTYEIVDGNKGRMYFSLLARAPEFLIGVLASVFKVEDKKFFIRNSLVISRIGVVGLLFSAFYLNESSQFPGVYAILPCFSTALLLATPNSNINHFLSKKILVYIGEISYSVYLWHWPIMAFFRYYNIRYDFTIFEMLLIIGLTITTSLFSYYLIEKPLRLQARKRLFVPLIFIGALNTLMVYFVADAKNKVSNMPIEYLYPSFGMESNANNFERVGVYGSENISDTRILLLGDSHAHGFKPYLHILGQKENFSFRSITNSFYPTLPTLPNTGALGDNKYNTWEQLKPYIESEVDSADVIIVYFAADNSDLWSDPARQFLESLKMNQKVLFMSDYPTLNKNPGRLNKSFIKDTTRIQDYELTFHSITPGLLKVIENSPNAKYVDLSQFESFFNDAPFYRDTLMYFDPSHLNYFGAVKYQEVSGSEFMRYLHWAIGD